MTGQARRAVPWDEINERRRDQDAKAPGAPRDLSGCTGPNCSAMIRWAVTADGRRMPVDYAPDPAGNLVRVMVAKGDWRIRVLADGEDPGPDVLRWTSHYATCPDADRFRARGRRAGAARPAPDPAAPGVLLAVDGNSLAHRAWHAYERSGMTTPAGRPVFAVHGFLALLAGIIDRTDPDAIVVGFDDHAGSTRRDRYPDYKAGRAEKSPDLYAQLADIAAVLPALGVQVIVPEGLEADDVLGSAAAAAETADWRCVIATSDKDAFGLITEATSVLRLVSGLDNAVHMTPQALLDQYGVTPAQWLDYAALVGDTSDNLPGVTGIGPKTAAKLLAALGSVDAALADPAATAAAIGNTAAAKLAGDEARAALDRNHDIMAIARDVPVDPDACRPQVTPATVAAVLHDRHLPSLIDRVTAALCRPAPPSSPPAPRQRRHLSVVPDPIPSAAAEPIPPAPPLVPADPAPVCSECGRECAAALPLAQLGADRTLTLTGAEILVDREHPSGELLAVLVGDVWAVRRIPAGEHYLPSGNRRQAHHCPVYPHKCDVPECGEPARLYPCGPRCDGHAPGATRRAHTSQPCRTA